MGVDELQVLSVDNLSIPEARRAYQVLGFIAHAYIWSENLDRLPDSISMPWIQVSKFLGLPPIATYASLCLWNYKQIIPNDDMSFNNLTTINTFTGSIDESWFYLVSVYFEKQGAVSIETGLEIIKQIKQDNKSLVIELLQQLAESIDVLGSILMRMEENCDPHVFYYRLRPYLAGWKNMQDIGLKGVYYGNELKNYAGGSNAQSSLIQFLDILLGIQHNQGFIQEMREYMPGKHREFLIWLEQETNIKDYINKNPDIELYYDACLAMLKSFRDKHIQITTRYIILQKNKNLGSSSTIRSGLSKKNVEVGTGGTSLLPFLKQCRDDTGSSAAGQWGKKILSQGVLRLKKADEE
ncbi:unnamed protein product [Candida verbasci]|uniref:Indoleamine 2,3-dioxygenase n=1 Tax=Candida verbasci TaxID=1227364 RepID=A0A9W4XI25_9ASCO|nr:unnamed protein product [Candida verbasci]